METITNRAGVTFSMWDFGGGDKIRPLWKHHVPLPSGERPNQRISLLPAKYTNSKYNYKRRRYYSYNLNQETSRCDIFIRIFEHSIMAEVKKNFHTKPLYIELCLKIMIM